MKVSEIPYERFSIEAFCQRAEAAIAAAAAAKTAKQLSEVRAGWLELTKEFTTAVNLAFIRFTLNTKDDFYRGEKDYYDGATPVAVDYVTRFERAVLENPHAEEAARQGLFLPLVLEKYRVDLRAADKRVVGDLQEENRCVTEYSKLMSEMLFEFQGEKIPLATLKQFMSAPERETRKQAYGVLGKTLEANSQALDGIFDRLVEIRTRAAKKLGYRNFIELGYYRMGRLCYDQDMVETFRRNVVSDVVPRVAELRRELGEQLGIDRLMLYDNDTYFAQGNPRPVLSVEGIFAAGRRMYEEMSPETGDFIRMMLENQAFDVTAREGKWGGGYCDTLPKYRQPFILANFNGTSGDVDVLTHEAGHAFADYMTAQNDCDLGIGGMETAETHSMSMEFFCWKWMDGFFGERARDYRFMHLLDSISFIPYGCMVDHFQHIVYGQPDMTPAERNAAWRELEAVYRPHLQTEDILYLERGTRWQYQMHIYENPFYYIDYCLAQSVALQFLLLSQKDFDGALRRYFEFLRQGGQKVFTQLTAEAGLRSPFSQGALAGVIEDAVNLLKTLQ